MSRALWWLASILGVMVLTCALLVFAVITDEPAQACGPGSPSVPASISVNGVAAWSKYNQTQTHHAATIVATGRSLNLPPRAWVVALGTALQESTLDNLPNPIYPSTLRDPRRHPSRQSTDQDSVGLFQQRPSQGWGKPEELMDPATAAKRFYNTLAKIKNWQSMRLTEAIQAVQNSGTPEAYTKWEKDAEGLAAHVANVGSVNQLPGASQVNCSEPAAAVGTGGWTQPTTAKVGQRFKGGGHAGVDIMSARNSPIRAAAAGEIIDLQCNSSTGTCDADGSSQAQGCGWYLDIRHAGSIVTRYCHFIRHPEVKKGDKVEAGKIIGFTGSSGNSSGPHLHLEVHRVSGNSYANNGNAIDPVQYFRSVGAPLNGTGSD